MCGIVAYLGEQRALPFLLQGLRRLEYRGYDSAGICIREREGLWRLRVPGKVQDLVRAAEHKDWQGTIGIAHTRWATHGPPTEANAHPHMSMDGQWAVVHNGIIENASELRRFLEAEHIVFRSDTDTEVIAHLLQILDQGDLIQTVHKVLANLEGTFGLVIQSAHYPDALVAARRGSPLLLGVLEDGFMVASDALALSAYTKQIVEIQEAEVVNIHPKGFEISSPSHLVQCVRETEDSDPTLGDSPHWMYKEILEQEWTLAQTLRGRLDLREGMARLGGLDSCLRELREVERVILVGCGSSYHAALCGEYLIEAWAGIPVEVEFASEFRGRNPVIGSKTAVLCLSQSGETADTLAALREARRKGALVLGICNRIGSTLARESDAGVYLHAGPELSVASTKALTSQLMVLALIGLHLGRMRRMSHSEGARAAGTLLGIPSLVVQLQKDLMQEMQIWSIEASKWNHVIYLGRGALYPVALEGALKLKEVAYIHAYGLHAAELKHGPLAIVEEGYPGVFLVGNDPVQRQKTLSNVREFKARGGRAWILASEPCGDCMELADRIVVMPQMQEIQEIWAFSIALQWFAYYTAVGKGCEVDQPRNLAKSVTVE